MTKIVYASQTGAKLDSDVQIGGGTDDTKALQDVLDEAQNGGVHLIMDGAARITGLRLHSNTTIECLNKDCGFYLADNTNGPLLYNAHQSFHHIQDRHIRIVGGTYNHNCAHQEHDAPIMENAAVFHELDPSVFQSRHWVMGFEFIGVEDLVVTGITLCDQRTFGMLVANWKHVEMTDILIDLPHRVDCQNQDGIHFWGPGQFLTMRNIRGCSGDDFIALAPDEHDRVSAITDVLIDGVMLDEADQGIRLLSREKGRLDRVVIRNVMGTYKSFGFYINSWFPNDFGGNFGNILFENIDLRPLMPNYTYRPPFLFQMGGHIEHLTLRHVQDHKSLNQRTLVEISSAFYDLSQEQCPTKIDELTIDGLSIQQEEAPNTPALLVDGEVDRLVIRNLDVFYDRKGEVPFIQCGPLGHIELLTMENVIVQNAGNLTPENVRETIMWNIHGDKVGAAKMSIGTPVYPKDDHENVTID